MMVCEVLESLDILWCVICVIVVCRDVTST